MSTIPIVQPPVQSAMGETPPPPAWTRWHTLSLVVIIIAIGVLGVATPGLNLSKLASWLINLALFVAFLVVVGHGVTGRPLGLLIDDRKKMSLSRLQMVLWTITILSGLLTAALSNIGLFIAALSNADLQKQLGPSFAPLAILVSSNVWLLMGISTTSLIGSPLLNSNKMRDGKIETRDDPHDAEVADLFRGEELSNNDVLDLAKVQMFFFTVVLVLAYAVLIGAMFIPTASQINSPITKLPELDPSMITLLGISHAGYLANKAVPHPDAPPQPAG
jgi:hypothetical protein